MTVYAHARGTLESTPRGAKFRSLYVKTQGSPLPAPPQEITMGSTRWNRIAAVASGWMGSDGLGWSRIDAYPNRLSFTGWLVSLLLLYIPLYSKGRILGHKRGKRNTRPNTSLIQIEGVSTKEDAQFYLGKRLAYVYRAKTEVRGSKIRVIWGRVTRAHGSSGVVKSKFRSNLPPQTFGASVRVMLYPSTI
ncbi:hypothetical protein BOTBODRAFT_181730 [Botryobasidium botryosum FD-172 SS1]|uniref:Ribosomal protein L35Ae n=1 Tax=Botryobasidium botryosum (strain FD-172 SS1) TaxID=930990 RepID=A0A067M442_BOTB1|nr:hypothetical protein BOTBODRAFT_181730 [Botryobasidium botryosum FD-172 SS1]